MPKLRKKTSARKATKRVAAKSKRAPKKVAVKSKNQLKSIEKNLNAMLKKALGIAKSEAKKANAASAKLQKKLAAAEKKNNSVIAKQAAIEKKISEKGSKAAKKSLTAVKKSGRISALQLKKVQKQAGALEVSAQNAKCHDEMLQALAKTIAQFQADWKKQVKSPSHQAAKHAPTTPKVAAKKGEKKADVKKMNRPHSSAPMYQNPTAGNNGTSETKKPLNPYDTDDSSF